MEKIASARRRPRPRKFFTRAIVFLLLGAIVNIAVAWGIATGAGAIPIRKGQYRALSVQAAGEYWASHAPAAWHDVVHRDGNAVESWALGRRDLIVMADDPTSIPTEPEARKLPQRSWAIGYFATGWPMLAANFETASERYGKSVTNECSWCWRIDKLRFPSKTVPLRPLWPGFAINTAFYAAVLWMVFVVPRALNRKRRSKRGLCVKCAYDLRGAAHDRCPECGQSLQAAGI